MNVKKDGKKSRRSKKTKKLEGKIMKERLNRMSKQAQDQHKSRSKGNIHLEYFRSL